MAIHDLWSFDNAPVGVNLAQSSTSNLTGNNTSTNPYYYYTGNPGMVYPINGGSTVSVTSDGFLTFQRGSGGVSNPMLVMASQVQNWTTSNKFWLGFRTKANYATTSASTAAIFGTQASFAGNYTKLITDGDLGAAVAANTEVYVELLIDATTGMYAVYANGNFVRSATYSNLTSASEYSFDVTNTGGAPANSTRGYRDFYWLDVDSVDTARLGPIRSSPMTLANMNAADWTANGAASVAAALSAVLENPPVTTVSASQPSDNQVLSALLSTGVAAGTSLIAVQPQASLLGDANNNTLDMILAQATNYIDTGNVKFPVSANVFNQRWGIQRLAPDGGVWTPAKVNATTLKLTPVSVAKTSLLLHFDGLNGSKNIIDTAGNPATPNGDAAISTAQFKIGGSSLSVDGINASYVTMPGTVFAPGSNDFCVELWYYPTTLNRISTFFRGDNGAAAGIGLDFGLNTNGAYAGIQGNATTIVSWAASNFSVNNWYHIALVCQSGKWYLYVNGAQVASASNASLQSPTYYRVGGSSYSANYGAVGYIDEVRVSNFARYTAAFTPQLTPFVMD
jgi:hypothetical protein